MPRLFKTIKITADTHRAIKLAAAQEGVSMAQLIEKLVKQYQDYHTDNEYRHLLQARIINANLPIVTTTKLPDGSYSHTFSSQQEEQ